MTLGELAKSFQLYAVCVDCERMERVAIAPLVARLGGETGIDAVRGRLRCSGCRQRTGDLRIVYVGCDSQTGFHYR